MESIKSVSWYPLIYKFRNDSDFTIDEISNCYIFLPNRKILNDPFDVYEHFIVIPNENEKLRKTFENYIKWKNPGKTRQIARNESRDIIKKNKNLKDLFTKETNRIIDNYGIGSFTTTFSNFMMWSHYSNFHKGLCIEFNVEFDTAAFKGIHPVEYFDDFIPFEWAPFQDDAPSITKLFYSKSKDWQSEAELRILKENYGPIKINPAAVSKIIFGNKSNQDFISKIVSASKNKYPNLHFFKCVPMKTSFGVQLEELKV